MLLLSTILIAISLSIDSFSVSIASSICCDKAWTNRNYLFAVVLAVFQAGLFYLGWQLAANFRVSIEALDHWIAFILLVVIGINMIREGIQKWRNPSNKECYDPFTFFKVILLAIGTSIDAMAVGIAFACADRDWSATYPIFVATLIFSSLGLFLGQRLKKSIKFPFEIGGGIILIVIGTKILIEHLLV